MEKKLAILILLDEDKDGIARLKKICPGVEIRIGPWLAGENERIPAELTQGADLLLCELPPENFDDFDQLKLVQLTSHGYSQVFNLPIIERDIRVCNGLGNFDVPIAEWNISMMVNLARDLRGMIRSQEAGVWDRHPRFQREIHGSVVGFFGYGGIARETARLAKAFGMTVYAFDAQPIGPRKDIYVVPGTGDRSALSNLQTGPGWYAGNQAGASCLRRSESIGWPQCSW